MVWTFGWEFASGPESVTFVKKFQNGYIIITCIPMYNYKCLLIVTVPKLKPHSFFSLIRGSQNKYAVSKIDLFLAIFFSQRLNYSLEISFLVFSGIILCYIILWKYSLYKNDNKGLWIQQIISVSNIDLNRSISAQSYPNKSLFKFFGCVIVITIH